MLAVIRVPGRTFILIEKYESTTRHHPRTMLQAIHDHLKGIFAITILVALGVVFVFWGVDVSVGSFAKAQGIEVNGTELDADGVRRQYQEELSRFEAAMGAAGVPEEMRTQLRTRVLEQAVRSELIRQRTRELRFAISDAAVLEAIRQIPAFQVEGKFSPDAYHAALRSAAIQPEQFEAEQRAFAVARQLDRGIYTSAFVLPAEVEREVALRNETREIAWVSVPASDFLAGISPDDAALAAYYESHKQLFQTEEQVTIEYVELDLEALAAAVSISEQQLREYYESNAERYSTEGRRRARHILIEAGADEAAAEAKARAAYDRARAGEDFGKLAQDLSADAGTASAGGDLGWAQRADFVGAFGDAVWDMQPGEIRGPVRSEFGFHVIRLEEVETGSTRSFEEVKSQLEPELRRAEVEKRFGDQQEELDTLAFEAAGDLAVVAVKLGLPIQRVDGFTRAGGGELGRNPALVEAVFSPDVLAGRELQTVELSPGRVVAVRVAAHEPASARPFATVREQVTAAARLEEASRRAGEQAKSIIAELSTGKDWPSVTKRWQTAAVDPPSHQPRLVRRTETGIPAQVMTAVFGAPRPEGRPRFGTATLDNGDTAVWSVAAVRAGSLGLLPPAERQREQERARERASTADATAYVDALRAAADVDVNPQVFE